MLLQIQLHKFLQNVNVALQHEVLRDQLEDLRKNAENDFKELYSKINDQCVLKSFQSLFQLLRVNK